MKKQIAPISALLGAALLVMAGCGTSTDVGTTPVSQATPIAQSTNTPGQTTSTKAFGETKPEPIFKLQGHESYVYDVAFSPDGKMLAAAGVGTKIELWDTQTGKLLETLDGHGEDIQALAFSPDGKLLASASDDYTVKLWNMPGGSLARTLEGHELQVIDLAFTPDSKTLVSISWDHFMKFWDPQDGSLVREVEVETSLNRVAVSPDGRTIATGTTGGRLQTWNADGTLIETVDLTPDSPASIDALVYSPDGKTLVAGTTISTVEVVNADDLTTIESLTGHRNYVEGAAYAPNGEMFATGALNGGIKIWNAADNSELYEVEAYGGVNGLDFSPDSNLLASTSSSEVWLWGSK